MAQILDEFDLSEVRVKAEALAAKRPFSLPSGKSMLPFYKPMHFGVKRFGRARIESVKARHFAVVNMRCAVLLGAKPMSVDYGREVEFNKLYLGKDMWTSDQPVEIWQQYLSFQKAQGHVLVGGLGLGMCVEMMLRMPKVKTVTVVEKSKDVIGLIQPQINRDRVIVIHDDIYKYLHKLHSPEQIIPYDFAYHDVWGNTGERTWASDVVSLCRLSQKAGIRNIGAWGEFEMQAQMRPSLYLRALLPKQVSDWKPYRVFMNACIAKLGQEPPFPYAAMPKIESLADLYLQHIGTEEWESTFDWDRKEVKRGR